MVSLSKSIAALIELGLSKAAARAEITDAMKQAVAVWEASDDNPSEMVRRIVEWHRRGRPGNDPTALVSEAGKRALQAKPTQPAALARLRLTKVLRSRMGLAGSVVDMLLSGWTAWDEYRVDDFNAAIAMGISALGSALSVFGYVTSYLNPAIGIVLIAAGEILMLVGTVAYAFCKNSEIESWLDHCLWGSCRSSSASGSTKWSRGPLSQYHGDLTKQIIAFDEILFPLELQWRATPTEGTVFGSDDLCFLEVRCPMLLATGSTLSLGIYGETSDGWCQEVRPFGPAQLSHGGIVVRAQGYRSLSAICRIDLYGDGQHVLPHDEFRVAQISPPPSSAYKRSELA
jgi:hypothetical protein